MNSAALPPRWPTRNPLARRRLRRRADRVLRSGMVPSTGSALLGVRSAELTSRHERRRVARSLHGVLHELDGTTLPGASPVYRPGVRPYADRIEALERRVGDAEPVTARGMLMVRELLTDPDGPLYDSEHVAELPDRIDEAFDALDGRR